MSKVSACTALAFLLAGCTQSPEPARLSGRTMGTTYHVTSDVPPGMSAEEMQAEIDARLETVNDQMSAYRPESELSRFNRFTGTDWFEVSGATAKVASRALEIHRESGGAFDPTIGPLRDLWHNESTPDAHPAPTDAAVREAMNSVGAHELEVRTDPPALKKDRAEITLDLSAIAKGYGVDVICEYLEEIGSENYLVRISDEVRARGLNSENTPWGIDLTPPAGDRQSVQPRVRLSGKALAASQAYHGETSPNGPQPAPLIDPLTGRPIDHTLAAVSVVAKDCMTADALATTLMVLGPEQGYTFAEEKNLPALLILREGDRYTEKPSSAFQQYLLSRPDIAATTVP